MSKYDIDKISRMKTIDPKFAADIAKHRRYLSKHAFKLFNDVDRIKNILASHGYKIDGDMLYHKDGAQKY
jgi:hypothetical protein